MKNAMTLARALAPEDIVPGRYVAVLAQTREYCPSLYHGESVFAEPKIVRVRWLPDEAEQAMQVVAVCLPFVLTRTADKKKRLIDTRQYELAEIPIGVGQSAFGAEEKKEEKGKKKGGKKRK